MKYTLIVGLGNVGSQYNHTPHNIGFHIIEKISSLFNFSEFEEEHKFLSRISKMSLEQSTGCRQQGITHTILLGKPNTYMNRSGVAIQKIKSYYKIPIDNIIIIHDEFFLPLGKIRIKNGGSDAGHNGIKSIDTSIDKNYWRIRVGVNYNNSNNQQNNQICEQLDSFVLKKFKNLVIVDKITDEIAKLFPIMISEQKQQLAAQFNAKRLFQFQDNK